MGKWSILTGIFFRWVGEKPPTSWPIPTSYNRNLLCKHVFGWTSVKLAVIWDEKGTISWLHFFARMQPAAHCWMFALFPHDMDGINSLVGTSYSWVFLARGGQVNALQDLQIDLRLIDNTHWFVSLQHATQFADLLWGKKASNVPVFVINFSQHSYMSTCGNIDRTSPA